MGSKQKRALYDRIHNRYHEKYPDISVEEIRILRHFFLTEGKDLGLVIDYLYKKILAKERHIVEQQAKVDRMRKSLHFLSSAKTTEIEDLTERNPQDPK